MRQPRVKKIPPKKRKYLRNLAKAYFSKESPLLLDDCPGSDEDEEEEEEEEKEEERPPPPPWYHNPAHDMESIFWLMLYYITNKEIIATPREDPQPNREGRRPWAFTPLDEGARRKKVSDDWYAGRNLWNWRGERLELMRTQNFLARLFDENPVHPCLRPLDMAIWELRRAVVVGHYDLQEDLISVNPTALKKLHDRCCELLEQSYDFLEYVSCTYDVHVRSLREAAIELDTLPPLPYVPYEDSEDEEEDNKKNGKADAAPADPPKPPSAVGSPKASTAVVAASVTTTADAIPATGSRKRSREGDSDAGSTDGPPAKSARNSTSHASPSATTTTAVASASRNTSPLPTLTAVYQAKLASPSSSSPKTAVSSSPPTRVLGPRKSD